jgi:hypothetical protein
MWTLQLYGQTSVMSRNLKSFGLREFKYTPLPSQKAFHRLQARFKGFSGPVGTGKSRALCFEAIRLAFLNSGRIGLLGAPTYPMLRDATQVAFLKMLDENEVPYQINRAEQVLTVLETGSRILFRSVDNFERLRGTNLAWFGVDELSYCPEEAWLRLEARLRDPEAAYLCGFGVWTPKGYDWIYRRFIENNGKGYSVILAKPFENRHLLDSTPDYYERLQHSYDAQLYAQEVLGEYSASGTGRVYHAFDRTRNVRNLALDPRLPLLLAMDFNVEPMCAVVVQIAGDDVHVLDEMVLSRVSTRDMCEEFHNRYERYGPNVTVYGDATGNRMQTAGTSDYRMVRESFRARGYRSFQLKVPTSNPPVKDRVALVNGKLFSAAQETSVWVHPKCTELIRDLEEVNYKPDSQIVDKTSDLKRTHVSDALGYLIWQEFGKSSPLGEQNRRLL